MKTLICIDGQENALKAARTAGRAVCSESSDATLLSVARPGRYLRGKGVPDSAAEIFSLLRRQTPELGYLSEAEEAFMGALGPMGSGADAGEWQIAPIQVADGLFHVGRVQLQSTNEACLKIREGVPQESILEELTDRQYDLAMLGAHRLAGCPWTEIENGPLYVAQRAECPVMVIGKDLEEEQPLLVCVGDKDPAPPTSGLVKTVARRLKSDIEVVTVLKAEDPTYQFGPGVSSMMDAWTKSDLKVTSQVLSGDPVTVILERAPNYGLTVCSANEKGKKGRLGKITKSVLCSQVNLLVSR